MYVKEKVEERKEEESRRFQDFRERKQGAFCERRLEADLRKSQRSCEQLDSAKVWVLSLPFVVWFCIHWLCACINRGLRRHKKPTFGQLN